MPNHLHLFFRTPEPNLSRGMQYLLSGYANWYAKRHQRPGHLFQGRFKGELIEDETYFWAVSRYLHLNPVRGKRPLVEHPKDWPWSSYPVYARRTKSIDWIAYDVVYNAWQAEMGGSQVEKAYRRFVEAGIAKPPDNPLQNTVDGWLLGSQTFVKTVRQLMKTPTNEDEVPAARRLSNLPTQVVFEHVAKFYGTTVASFFERRNGELSRDLAAWFARRLTTATLRELAPAFGLWHPDSVSNLVRRANRAIEESKKLQKQIDEIKKRLRKTENRI